MQWHPDWITVSKSSCCVSCAPHQKALSTTKVKICTFIYEIVSVICWILLPSPPCPTVLKTWSKQESSLLSIFLSNDTSLPLMLSIILFCLCKRKKRIPDLYTKTQIVNYRIPLKHCHLLFRTPLRYVRKIISSSSQLKPCHWIPVLIRAGSGSFL